MMPKTPVTKPIEQYSFLHLSRNIGAQLILFVFVVCLIYLAKHPELVTMTFTNIGFAVFLALANTCFSWARSLTEEIDKDNAKSINTTAMCCIFCALAFVTSSILQFVVNTASPPNSDVFMARYFFYFLTGIRFVLISIVLVFGFSIIIELVRIIFKSLVRILKQSPEKSDN